MKTKTLSPRTLGMYLGCKYERNSLWVAKKRVTRELALEAACDWMETHILILRPLESMTEEERTIYFKLRKADVMHDHDTFESMDWLRSHDFDCGGWYIEDGEEKWTDSLIKEGLAKPKNTKQL